MISISRKDIIWGYFAQAFSFGSGLITLPLVLKLLSAEEIGMNYIMLTIGSMISLFDFGFTPQFSRNITYIFSGAKELQKVGVSVSCNQSVDYKLLTTMIETAKFVYKRLAIIALVVMLSLGTVYIYFITNNFQKVENALLIWLIFSASIFFNIYYSYYPSLLTGKGLITESYKTMIYSKLTYISLTFIFLYFGTGLIGLVIANFISPFVSRYLSHSYFFTKDLLNEISFFNITQDEKLALFEIVWHNTKKVGLVFVGTYAINKLSIFFVGLFLNLSDVASYGLMVQFFGLLTGISSIYFSSVQPRFSSLRAIGEKKLLLRDFAISMNVYYVTFLLGSILIIFIAPFLLLFFNSKVTLPETPIVVIFSIVLFLEGNHSNFATLIVTNNDVPFVRSSLFAGLGILVGDLLVLNYTHLGILGLVLVQGAIQLSYANWKWPFEVCKDFNLSFIAFVKTGFRESLIKFNLL